MTKSKFNLLFPFLCLVLCLSFPSVCAEGVRKGAAVSVNAVLPALFPALILSAFLVRSVQISSEKSFFLPYIIGLFCGFPVGAATAARLVREKKLAAADGEKLLFFCNNAGPAFLISYCGEQILSDAKKGFFLFLMQSVFSSLFLLFFFGKRLFVRRGKTDFGKEKGPSFWKILPDAIREGTNSFIYIISCVIFFSFLNELIRYLFSLRGIFDAVIGIFTELCGGLTRLERLPTQLAFPLCALGCGWGGFSVHLQTAGILEGTPLSVKYHLAGKVVFSLLMFLSALFFQKLL